MRVYKDTYKDRDGQIRESAKAGNVIQRYNKEWIPAPSTLLRTGFAGMTEVRDGTG